MKICLFCDHSETNVELARLTAQNRWDYTARHGYDLFTVRMTYAEGMVRGFLELHRLLGIYDLVFRIGSDVVITNPTVKLEYIAPADGKVAAMSKQMLGGINNDVTIWRGGIHSQLYVSELASRRAAWEGLPYLWQSFVSENPVLLSEIDVWAPAKLNANDLPNDCGWRESDFVCHCLSGTLHEKIRRVRSILKKIDSPPDEVH